MLETRSGGTEKQPPRAFASFVLRPRRKHRRPSPAKTPKWLEVDSSIVLLFPDVPCAEREPNSHLVDHPERFPAATSRTEAFQRFTNTRLQIHALAPSNIPLVTPRLAVEEPQFIQPVCTISAAEDVQPIGCARPNGRVSVSAAGRSATRGDLLPGVALRTKSRSNLHKTAENVLGSGFGTLSFCYGDPTGWDVQCQTNL